MEEKVPSSGGVVYGLFDPGTGELRYVGVTRQPLKKRLWSHVKDARSGREGTWKAKWIRKVLAQGAYPEVEALERWETRDELLAAEVWCIEYFRSIGCRLTNTSPGGDSPTFDDEARRKVEEYGERIRKLTDEQLDEAVQQYNDGKIEMVSIAKAFGVSPTTLGKWLVRSGVKMRGIAGGTKLRPGIPEDQKETAVRDYVAGAGVDDLAMRYRCSQAKVYAVLRAAGVVRRTWRKRANKIRSVLDLETGVRYRYQSDVAAALGVSRALVCVGIASGVPVKGHRLQLL